MKYSRVLLINSFLSTSNTGALRPPAGLGYIAESLERNGIDYEVIDTGLGYKWSSLKRKINSFDPDLIGVSAMTFGYKKTYEMIREIRKIRGDRSKIVMGGSHLSTFREETIRECPEIDFGVVLEGEESIIELCQGKEPCEIRGLVYGENGQIIYNGDREFIKNLDTACFPKYEKFELKRYVTNEIPLVTSRGCPYDCIFCNVDVAIGRKFRARSAKSVVDEIEYWAKRGNHSFDVVDDNFTLLKNRVHEICDEIENRELKNLSFRIGGGVRVDKIDRNILKRMRDVGFNHIALGIESGSDKVLKNLNKKTNVETIKRSIKNACELGYDVTLFFLIGSPGERWDNIEESVSLALEFPVLEARFHNLIPFPKTKLYQWVEKHNYFLVSPAQYLNEVSQWIDIPVFQTPELTIQERAKALKYTSKIRKKVIKRALEKKLKPFWFLGKIVSSIIVSDFGQKLFYYNKTFRKFVDFCRRLIH